jgi:hypothetical protein
MGQAKKYWMEQQQQREDENLAKSLGLTYDELVETDWHIETFDSRDGMVYEHVVYFSPDSPKEILDKIIGLDSDNQVTISPFDDYEENFDDYEEQYDAIISNKHYYLSFHNELNNIRKLNALNIEDADLLKILKRQLYIAGIGTLETFLSETFVNLTDENDEYFKKFLKTYPEFKNRKVTLDNILDAHESIKNTARKIMLDVIYHNLDKVQKMYESTFRIKFPEIEELSISVGVRHDLVHRNGKNKAGEIVEITADMIEELLVKIHQFAKDISDELDLKQD